ncbi:MAG: hypothetical protein O7I42_12990 [Alphaproteobacteria bacterium]|nr:hypothetical protein [Alphaproteobacteria bacterium]
MANYVQTVWRQLRVEIGARPLGLPALKSIMIVIATLWIGGVGWIQISGSRDEYGIGSSAYRRVSEACSGRFAKRYKCKSSALISGENQAFIDWSLKLAIIFVPPLGLSIVYGHISRLREEREAEEARRRIRARRRRTV